MEIVKKGAIVKIAITVFVIYLPLLIKAQESKGIQWTKDLNWEQVKLKAKIENKLVFVNCFASWCIPCKAMAKNIYTDRLVGDFLNEKFICLNVQIDSSSQDDNNVNKWDEDVRIFKNKYNISEFPSYLFFSSDGKIVHKDIGYKNVNDFLEIAKKAIDPEQQYYTLIQNYSYNKKDYTRLNVLAHAALRLKDDSIAETIAQDYIDNYLFRLRDELLYTVANIQFIKSFTKSSKDRGFFYFYKSADKINQMVGTKDFSQVFITDIILKEEIYPKLWRNKKSILQKGIWTNMYSMIANKYGKSYAERAILTAKIKWYNEKHEWEEIGKLNLVKLEKYGMDTSGIGKTILNNIIFETIFLHCHKKETINKAIIWMEQILKSSPNDPFYIDTYANLLYKTGRRKEAIFWEEKAVTLNPKSSDIHIALKKMKSGDPTWRVPASDEKKE
jgi:thioredoxin-related protein